MGKLPPSIQRMQNWSKPPSLQVISAGNHRTVDYPDLLQILREGQPDYIRSCRFSHPFSFVAWVTYIYPCKCAMQEIYKFDLQPGFEIAKKFNALSTKTAQVVQPCFTFHLGCSQISQPPCVYHLHWANFEFGRHLYKLFSSSLHLITTPHSLWINCLSSHVVYSLL